MERPKVVIIMGATGTGKSKLAIDLASHFPIEIINADSMQVYKGLDILSNKVPIQDQKGVPHHLLGTISPNVEFTSKHFRDSAVQIIDEIIAREKLPVIVGGTNYYIQALVSPFLLDDFVQEIDDCSLKGAEIGEYKFEEEDSEYSADYQRLKAVDPDSANRIHPNDSRKINQYLSLCARSSVLPSKLFQGKTSKNWGRTYNCRYDCCFICVDASLPVLDQYVEERVDCMIDTGLLNEVYDIYNPTADYTRGLRQAIGVREFEYFLRFYLNEDYTSTGEGSIPGQDGQKLQEIFIAILKSNHGQHNLLLRESIDMLKTNTKRLVRRQKRRLKRLQTLFGWNLHYVNSTECLLGHSVDSWQKNVVEPSAKIIRSFLNEGKCLLTESENPNGTASVALNERDLWTRHVCKPCGNRILRGAHEWEQHTQGRAHRKRIAGLKKRVHIMVEREASQQHV